jgi:predicted methyltransferase
MKHRILFTSLALALAWGCGSKTADTEVAAPTEPVEAAPPAPPEPSPEEKKKAEEAAKLEADRTKMKEEAEADKARWTPELKEEAKKVAEKSYPNAKAALKAVVNAKYRAPGNADRDQYRHPDKTLEFIGFKPDQTVVEYSPGEGWYTELLAPALAKKGKLIITSPDPNGPADQRSTMYAERTKLFLEQSPELYGKVETTVVDGKAPGLKVENVDLILAFRTLHGMQNAGTLDAWLAAFHKALKPKGILGIEQHRAKADAKVEESSKAGYLPEAYVIEKVEAAGFKLAGKAEINANAKDTKDHPKGVWTLPPSYALGEEDKAKYTEIGESDRMTLKFVKK